MKYNRHPEYEGKHALFGASVHSWLRYDADSIVNRWISSYATELGTAIHELASHCIKNKIKINRYCKPMIISWLTLRNIPRKVYDPEAILCNLEPFVNDCISYHMESEVLLFYSPEAFGTTDAIRADIDKKELKIFDYKNGKNEASMEQPLIYSALFFLEYHRIEHNGKIIELNPMEWKIELRLYQNCEIKIYEPSPEEVINVMDIYKNTVEIVQEAKGVR